MGGRGALYRQQGRDYSHEWDGQLKRHGVDIRSQKLHPPVFEDGDAHDWLYRAEHYFEVNRVDERKKLALADLCLDEEALAWYQWCE